MRACATHCRSPMQLQSISVFRNRTIQVKYSSGHSASTGIWKGKGTFHHPSPPFFPRLPLGRYHHLKVKYNHTYGEGGQGSWVMSGHEHPFSLMAQDRFQWTVGDRGGGEESLIFRHAPPSVTFRPLVFGLWYLIIRISLTTPWPGVFASEDGPRSLQKGNWGRCHHSLVFTRPSAGPQQAGLGH